jgi:pSer/pThr/pTyr-binding forkhead associated (FHA) protein
MEFDIGISCGNCDTFSPIGTSACPICGHELSLTQNSKSIFGTDIVASEPVASHRGKSSVRLPEISQPSEEKPMELARNYICRECSMSVPSGHKFCGTCGAAVPPEIVEMQTKYFGVLQAPGKARLILVRGEADVDGLSYVLQGVEHVAGKDVGQILFPEDKWMSPRHANFVYENDQLVVKDEGSVNGVYLRVRDRVSIQYGDQFICGEQVFRLEPTPPENTGADPDQTYLYTSPRRSSPFRIVQLLKGGALGSVFTARRNVMQIGREECEISFPTDVYMSSNHAKVEMSSKSSFTLVDIGSKNGTYYRIKQPQTLLHGDYLFLGKQLLRVEITA